MLGGYGAPLIITLMTCIFQFYRPKCSIANPRIGEYHCFFPSKWIYQSIYCTCIHSQCEFSKIDFILKKLFFLEASFAKGLWFYLPIGIALSINACAFIFTVMKICSMDKKQREINMRSGKRNESMERYVVLIIFDFFYHYKFCLNTAFNIFKVLYSFIKCM